jgi:hypothetical protein
MAGGKGRATLLKLGPGSEKAKEKGTVALPSLSRTLLNDLKTSQKVPPL